MPVYVGGVLPVSFRLSFHVRDLENRVEGVLSSTELPILP